MDWTEDDHKKLKSLRDQGLSFSQCAIQLGISKGSVAGACYRMGKMARMTKQKPPVILAPPSPKPSRKPVERKTKPAEKPKTAPLSTKIDDDTGLYNPVLALKNKDCRWPIGDPRSAKFRFCCAPREGTGPYCAEHTALAYVPVPPKKVKKNPLRR